MPTAWTPELLLADLISVHAPTPSSPGLSPCRSSEWITDVEPRHMEGFVSVAVDDRRVYVLLLSLEVGSKYHDAGLGWLGKPACVPRPHGDRTSVASDVPQTGCRTALHPAPAQHLASLTTQQHSPNLHLQSQTPLDSDGREDERPSGLMNRGQGFRSLEEPEKDSSCPPFSVCAGPLGQ